MEATEAALLARARAGDSDAFGELVKRHSRGVFAVAFRVTGNEHDAEDVVQETFIKAYRQLGRFEERARFSTWLTRIAANCAVDLLRSRSNREPANGETEMGGAASEACPCLAPLPDRAALGGEVRERIQVAMAELTAMERAAFVLRHFEGESIEVISAELGLKASATKHSIFRAVRKMRAALEPFVRPAAAPRGSAGSSGNRPVFAKRADV
ncbi:MAG: sigma-70 family RNA polymerase sigma factor [Luteitalea sp.]|nr:sigma-70 family RNA polymerase sigma factor [Luteitalea sp.]